MARTIRKAWLKQIASWASVSAFWLAVLAWTSMAVPSIGAESSLTDAVTVTVNILDPHSDGVVVRGRMHVSVVNQSGAPLSAVALRLERPASGIPPHEVMELGHLDVDATGVVDANVILAQSFLASGDPFVFQVSFTYPNGEAAEVVVPARRPMGGGL